jgi:hypothetical protein
MNYSTPAEFAMFYWWDLYFKMMIHSYFMPYENLGMMSKLENICKT